MRRKKLSQFFRFMLSQSASAPSGGTQTDHAEEQVLSGRLAEDLSYLKGVLTNCSDVMYREFVLESDEPIHGVIIWTDGLVNNTSLNDQVMRSVLQEALLMLPDESIGPRQAYSLLRDHILTTSDTQEQAAFTDIVNSILNGNTVLMINGVAHALIASTRGMESRAISEPVTEGVVRGPRQGFNETIRKNTALLRKIIKTPDLKMEMLKAGTLTRTDIVIAYIQGVAKDSIVDEVRRRIKQINLDSILESSYIEEMIEDHPYSPFPQIAHTERPDKAAAELLEGKVIIMVDGTPFVLLVPTVFVQFLQSSEDYYERYPMAFAVRFIRYLFFFIALLLPSAYIAATTYHQEMLPTPLLISVAGSREGVPFPAFIEALLMEITFEALREAGVRLPRPVGQAVSIVGALVIGEAAVQAGIVSPAMVIVVAVTAIASFTIPAFNAAITIRMLRFPVMALAAVLGFYGIMLGVLAILIHLCSLRSFGVPYLAPVAPFTWNGMKDMVWRSPWWLMKKRPSIITSQNVQRQVTRKEPPNSS